VKVKGERVPLSRQFGDFVGPGLDRVLDGIVLVGREPDGPPGEGDVVVVTRGVVALELRVVGLAGEVPLGHAAHRGCKGRVVHDFGGVRLERGDRRGLQGNGPDLLALAVDEVHLRGVVLAVLDDGGNGLAGLGRIPDAPEGVVGDDALDEGVKRRYVGDRDGEVPDRRFVDGSLDKVCHGFSPCSLPCLYAPGNMTDDYRVDVGGYQSDFIGEGGLGSDSLL
jgi:hypothetical protein